MLDHRLYFVLYENKHKIHLDLLEGNFSKVGQRLAKFESGFLPAIQILGVFNGVTLEFIWPDLIVCYPCITFDKRVEELTKNIK